MLNEIYKDKNGALWVSSFDGKSFIVHFTEDAPEEFPLPALSQRVKSQPAIMALSDAGEGKLWISQERTGLGLYDLTHDRVSLYPDFPSLDGLFLGSIKQMSEARREGNVWVIPEGYNLIYEFRREGMQIVHVRTLSLPTPNPTNISRRPTKMNAADYGQEPTTVYISSIWPKHNGMPSATH